MNALTQMLMGLTDAATGAADAAATDAAAATATAGALKNGDRVCTIGGIYGTITSIKDDTIELSVGRDNVKLVFARWAIRNVEEVAIENDSEVLN